MTSDPTPPADQGARSPRPESRPAAKRFWREATTAPVAGGHELLLDGRPARTPGRRPLSVPGPAAAEALAAEWNAVEGAIDPARMPLTRLANSSIDGVADQIEAVRADIVKYAGSDLVCYRAAEPETLVARQTELWDPVTQWARDALGARLVLAEGVMFAPQPEPALEAIAAAVGEIPAPHALAALHVVTTLTGSALLALALARGAMSAEEVWRAAHVDEDVQMEIWGLDEEASRRREARRAEYDAAGLLLFGR
ncbi:MAG: ATPase [Rhizobiales bacterium 65-9]|nr:ATPase [Hyphomicrobiales bacterium]OJY35552.1 MAG: ATPase [Rhizobiales bacterium 65-9]